MKLLIATHNQGKVKEYRALLRSLEAELLSLDDVGIQSDVAEDGDTYAENALAKARGYAEQAGLLTLADDSGLEVDALGGAPGLHSARFAGAGASDEDRWRLLLEKLHQVPPEKRTARFRCVIALVEPNGPERLAEGICEGRITSAPRGRNGFGFDPVFLLPERDQTMAELSAEAKNRLSHRARAAQKAVSILENWPTKG